MRFCGAADHRLPSKTRPYIARLVFSLGFLIFSCYFRFCQRNRWSRVQLERLIIPLLVKKCPEYCGTRRLIIVFTTASQLIFILKRTNAAHILPSSFCNVCFNIIFTLTHTYSKWSLPFRFAREKSSLHFSSYTCLLPARILHPRQRSQFDRPNSNTQNSRDIKCRFFFLIERSCYR
jgi:hypothetical protein